MQLSECLDNLENIIIKILKKDPNEIFQKRIQKRIETKPMNVFEKSITKIFTLEFYL